jgi:hypothetical protein
MKTEVYPLHLPAELLGQVRRVAADTGLSMADAMRQGLKLGLPRLQEQLAAETPRPEGYFADDYRNWPKERVELERAMSKAPQHPER